MGGGRKRGRSQRRHFKQERENVWKDNPRRPPASAGGGGEGSEGNGWQPFATENLAFEAYYKGQHIVPEEEWDAFMSMLRKPLPAAFRINARTFLILPSPVESSYALPSALSNSETDAAAGSRILLAYEFPHVTVSVYEDEPPCQILDNCGNTSNTMFEREPLCQSDNCY